MFSLAAAVKEVPSAACFLTRRTGGVLSEEQRSVQPPFSVTAGEARELFRVSSLLAFASLAGKLTAGDCDGTWHWRMRVFPAVQDRLSASKLRALTSRTWRIYDKSCVFICVLLSGAGDLGNVGGHCCGRRRRQAIRCKALGGPSSSETSLKQFYPVLRLPLEDRPLFPFVPENSLAFNRVPDAAPYLEVAAVSVRPTTLRKRNLQLHTPRSSARGRTTNSRRARPLNLCKLARDEWPSQPRSRTSGGRKSFPLLAVLL